MICFALGNPGKKYARTRHNIGFMVADVLAEKLKKKFESAGDYLWLSKEIGEKKITIVKPLLYMNNSGVVVKEYLEHFSAAPQVLVVICDDFTLPLGRIRIRERGGAGGHQGLASIIYHLATNNFGRLRIGIGNPPACDSAGRHSAMSHSEYVLSNFTKEELNLLPPIIERSVEAIFCIFEQGIKKAMTVYNSFKAN